MYHDAHRSHHAIAPSHAGFTASQAAGYSFEYCERRNPGYRATDFNFLDSLQAAQKGQGPVTLAVTQSHHIGPRGEGVQRVVGKLSDVPAGDLPLDANSVNIELEMAKMSDNAMQYNGAATIMGMRFRQLMGAIRDAR